MDDSECTSDVEDGSDAEGDGDGTFVGSLGSSSVDSTDDYICFVAEDEADAASVPREKQSAPVSSESACAEPWASSLKSEAAVDDDDADQDDQAAFDFSEDDDGDGTFDAELWRALSVSPMSIDYRPEHRSWPRLPGQCDDCLSAPRPPCPTHGKIAEANRELRRCAPPPQPGTARVRFRSGERLATVHDAPVYDRTITTDILDGIRERERKRRWCERIDGQFAPQLERVLTPEHRARVCRERPELVWSEASTSTSTSS